ncbi:SRP54-type protein GTPase domain family protein [Babesia bovis T2Bo]|uniref:SRP54-type protein, GTPase domain containing protein n=1 Tax=Babesia bovis TaxID=5865 RepID=A7ANF7_BABBO|nr:SRP54-type protein GTPase domain family protein [Babesia bovis T2Bo]EDO08091.1 SRP54-type protein GTPase domain family protein [Babesia bovis T2Bo]|eukprot:XP_001611659.1 SRP54-type protein, GTPase domain containing protein [Babesia bovis T2Bo]
MIDFACVVSRGGVVLWSQTFDHGFQQGNKQNGRNTVNKLIEDVILEERGANQQASVDGLNLRWRVMHSIDAVMYIIYQGIQNSQCLDEFLETAAQRFVKRVKKHHESITNINWITDELGFEYDSEFAEMLYKIGSKTVLSQPVSSQEQAQSKGTTVKKQDSSNKHEKLRREWGFKEVVSKKDIDALDYSTDKEPKVKITEPDVTSTITPEDHKPKGFGSLLDGARNTLSKLFLRKKNEVESKVKEADNTPSRPSVLDTFSQMVLKYAGNMVLTPEVIEEPLKELKLNLNTKNVANDISTMICDSISAGLVGKKTASLKSVSATVREALEDAVRRILTPKEPINLLRNVSEAKARGEVYSVLFLGVNGVGKSTSLAKVTYLLKCNGFKVMLIACDTFRSGAVEQLKIHADKLGVELFERGYGKDPSAICREGLKHARANSYDAVLIDTAGRMQDNEPLMTALAKLIHVNNPHLLLFVGEALVGNDAVDQLRKFNQAIQKMGDSSDELRGRKIDGIVLTKFDTVDDKVGAALSMCYITGQPVVFVGTGQTYTNLAKLEIDDVVRALTK